MFVRATVDIIIIEKYKSLNTLALFISVTISKTGHFILAWLAAIAGKIAIKDVTIQIENLIIAVEIKCWHLKTICCRFVGGGTGGGTGD